jgi:hypothetical protein
MNISDLGSLGEFIGALAVLVSLVYLALQIRTNTRAVRASTFQSVTSGWQNQIHFVSDPSLSNLIDRAQSEPEALEQADLSRLWLIARANFRLCENDYYQLRSGTFDSNAWTGYQNSIVQEILGGPAFRAMWALQRNVFSSDFARFMDEQVRLAADREKQSAPERLEELWKDVLRNEGAA